MADGAMQSLFPSAIQGVIDKGRHVSYLRHRPSAMRRRRYRSGSRPGAQPDRPLHPVRGCGRESCLPRGNGVIRNGILAFDRGVRPERRCAGLTLLERGIRTMARAGIERLVVVVPTRAPGRGWAGSPAVSTCSWRSCPGAPARISRFRSGEADPAPAGGLRPPPHLALPAGRARHAGGGLRDADQFPTAPAGSGATTSRQPPERRGFTR